MKVLQQNFTVVGQPEAELHILKFEKFNVFIIRSHSYLNTQYYSLVYTYSL